MQNIDNRIGKHYKSDSKNKEVTEEKPRVNRAITDQDWIIPNIDFKIPYIDFQIPNLESNIFEH